MLFSLLFEIWILTWRKLVVLKNDSLPEIKEGKSWELVIINTVYINYCTSWYSLLLPVTQFHKTARMNACILRYISLRKFTNLAMKMAMGMCKIWKDLFYIKSHLNTS